MMERLLLLYYVRIHGPTGVCQELINDVKSEPTDQISDQKLIRQHRGLKRSASLLTIRSPLRYPLGHDSFQHILS